MFFRHSFDFQSNCLLMTTPGQQAFLTQKPPKDSQVKKKKKKPKSKESKAVAKRVEKFGT